MAPAGSSSGSGSDSDDDAAGQQVRTVEGVVSGDVAAWLAAGKAWRRSHPSGGGGSSSKYGILAVAGLRYCYWLPCAATPGCRTRTWPCSPSPSWPPRRTASVYSRMPGRYGGGQRRHAQQGRAPDGAGAYNAKEGRLKPNRTGTRRQYDELLANRELPYPKKKAGK